MPGRRPDRRHARGPQRDRARRSRTGLRRRARGGGAPARASEAAGADAALISGYCAAVAGDAPGAGLAAELAREAGVKEGPPACRRSTPALGRQAENRARPARSRSSTTASSRRRAAAIETAHRLEAAGAVAACGACHRSRREPALRLAAAEAAAQVNAISAEQLADIYREQPATGGHASDAGGTDTPQRRAALFVAAEHERTPQKKVRLIRAFLDEAHRAGFYLTALRMAAPASDKIVAAPEIGWYAETGIEVALAAGELSQSARVGGIRLRQPDGAPALATGWR